MGCKEADIAAETASDPLKKPARPLGGWQARQKHLIGADEPLHNIYIILQYGLILFV
jgi:hypothetical protein